MINTSIPDSRDRLRTLAIDSSTLAAEVGHSSRALLDAAPLALTMTRTADHVMVYGNRRAAELLEVLPDWISDQRESEFWLNQVERDAFVAALLLRGRIDGHEARMRTRRGRVFWAHISAQTVEFAGELCMLAAIVDATDAHVLEARLRDLALIDPLTGVYNRSHFARLGETELQRAVRYKHPTSLALMDVDHFGALNDEMGRIVGDGALRLVVRVLEDAARSTDTIGRVGSDMFALLFPQTELKAARAASERIRRTVASTSLVGRRLPSNRRITLSVGVAQQQAGDVFTEVLRRAEEALYAAKSRRRGGLVVFAGDGRKG